jgi:pyrroloquinoline quinone biosynthesis protein B
MLVRVLGSAAGGGFPQWNCACRNCSDVRNGVPGLIARSQSSLAVSADGVNWCLLNASPDLRAQINGFASLTPSVEYGARFSPLKSVIVTNADVDHVAGLLDLREGQQFHLYASERVLAVIAANPIFGVLAEGVVSRDVMMNGKTFEPAGCPGLAVEMFDVPGKVPLYLEGGAAGADFFGDDGDVVGLKLIDRATGAFVCYVPGCAEVNAELIDQIAGAAALLFDGTLYTDDEMIVQGLSPKTGRRMGHISISGEDGSMARLAGVDAGRRIFIHLNNSNPALRESGSERQSVEAAGWEIAFDGMELSL